MSENDNQASEREQGGQEKDSVLDFLYHDQRRVGAFLAQFDPSGHLTELRQSESVAKNKKRGWKFSAGGGLPDEFGGGKGEVALERTPAEGGSEASERVYDPLWTNARTLLDYLEEREMMERNIANANIGQFVLASGSLEIRDLTIIQKAMPLAIALQTPPAPAPRDDRNRSQGWHDRKAAEDQAARQNQFGMQFLSLLPHAVHAQINSGGLNIWCSLKPDSLVVSSDDIFLKHGVVIPGKWHMLGILDARPDATSGVTNPEQEFAVAKAAIPTGDLSTTVALATNGFASFIDGIAPFCRLLLGRNSRSYGMTPLVIFREVTG